MFSSQTTTAPPPWQQYVLNAITFVLLTKGAAGRLPDVGRYLTGTGGDRKSADVQRRGDESLFQLLNTLMGGKYLHVTFFKASLEGRGVALHLAGTIHLIPVLIFAVFKLQCLIVGSSSTKEHSYTHSGSFYVAGFLNFSVE